MTISGLFGSVEQTFKLSAFTPPNNANFSFPLIESVTTEVMTVATSLFTSVTIMLCLKLLLLVLVFTVTSTIELESVVDFFTICESVLFNCLYILELSFVTVSNN